MAEAIERYEGGCHCGNLTVVFEATKPLEDLALRICGCSYCRRQDGLYVSDAAGRAQISAEDENRLIRYRFGHRTADFLICGICGVYLGAVMADGRAAKTVLNVKAFDVWADEERRAALAANVPTMDYDSEDEDARLSRREARWTPLVEAPGLTLPAGSR